MANVRYGVHWFSGRHPASGEHIEKKKESLVVFGCFCAIFIYGVIMNFSDVLLVAQKPTFALFFAACLRGLPFDCVHAIATGCALFLFAEPLLEKLERVKNKYGL